MIEVASQERVAELERLAHRTWPCRNQERMGDWILREADGFTRRANSCLAIGDSGLALEESVARVEAWFRSREIEPCFKITSAAPPELDRRLEELGWSITTPTITMIRRLEPEMSALAGELSVSAIPDSDWLQKVSLWDGESADKACRHAELARRIHSGGFLAWRTVEGVLAVGLVSMDGANSFLYDVVVHPERRGHGIGRTFCQSAMDWAASCGTRTMALQVLESNQIARNLYDSLGFDPKYRYHYRVAPGSEPTCGC